MALSFAGAQRAYVRQVAEALRSRGVRCFYDADEEIHLWGRYLAEELPAIYGEQAAAVVVFISADYAARDWTQHERRAALNRAVRERREYVLPARFDDTPLPGLLSDMAYVDLRNRNPQEFAEMIAAKLAALTITAPPAPGKPGEIAPKARLVRRTGAVFVGEADLRRIGGHAAISAPETAGEGLPEYASRDSDAGESGLLVSRWEDAKIVEPYAWAVLTAALDTARLGARAPLSVGLLRAAAVGYCTSRQQAEAPDDWFERALAYATAELHGTVAALSTAGAGIGQAAGYTVADYLIQHATRERRHARVPASTWTAIRDHIRDPADATRLADSARSRLLYGCAIPLYRHAAGIGYQDAADRLARLLAQRGDLDELRARADTGDRFAAHQLAGILADRGDLDEAEQILRSRADTGDWLAADRLAGILADRGDLDEAEQILRTFAETGDEGPVIRLTSLLAQRGDLDEAEQILRSHADGGELVPRRLADLLAMRGDLNGLRARANAGDHFAAQRLADLLAKRGDTDELRARANARDEFAAIGLADLLAKRGDTDEAAKILRARADTGDHFAAERLAGLLTRRGDTDEAIQVLRTLADTGDEHAAVWLADLLVKRGDLDEAIQVLRTLANTGDKYAANRLADLLAKRGDLDELRGRANTGDESAAKRLADLLAKRGDLDEAIQVLRTLADTGDEYAATRLADLLIQRGDLDELRARADTGDEYAATRLADLLIQRGDLDELRARANIGDELAAHRLADLLAKRGDLDEAMQVLRAFANTGDEPAARRLGDLLAKQGRDQEAERLRRFGLNLDGSIASN